MSPLKGRFKKVRVFLGCKMHRNGSISMSMTNPSNYMHRFYYMLSIILFQEI